LEPAATSQLLFIHTRINNVFLHSVCFFSVAVAFGFIDTRLTQSKGNSAVEVDGQKVVLGIPDGMRDMAVAMIPLQRHGSPEEAAGGILMLASPYAAYVSGHTLEVTGGFGI
jgi:3-oxoacyl-[acyl-carrier protein] reductase